MGVLTRTQMKTEVATILTRTDFSDSGGAIERRLDWAYEDVAEAKYWKVHQIEDKTTTLVTSTQDYAIPSALRTVETVTLVDTTRGTINFGSQTLNYTVGNSVVGGTDNATAVITSIVDNGATGTLTLNTISGTFANGETINETGGGTGNGSTTSLITLAKTYSKIDPEDLAEFQERGRNLVDDPGTPHVYTMIGNKIRLHNIPSSAYNNFTLYIIGKKKISYFSGDSSTSDLDQKLDRAIIYKAAQICYNDLLEEGDEANRYQRLAEKAINDAYSDELAYSTL